MAANPRSKKRRRNDDAQENIAGDFCSSFSSLHARDPFKVSLLSDDQVSELVGRLPTQGASAKQLLNAAFALKILDTRHLPSYIPTDAQPVNVGVNGLSLLYWSKILQFCSTQDKLLRCSVVCKAMRKFVCAPGSWRSVSSIGLTATDLMLSDWWPRWSSVRSITLPACLTPLSLQRLLSHCTALQHLTVVGGEIEPMSVLPLLPPSLLSLDIARHLVSGEAARAAAAAGTVVTISPAEFASRFRTLLQRSEGRLQRLYLPCCPIADEEVAALARGHASSLTALSVLWCCVPQFVRPSLTHASLTALSGCPHLTQVLLQLSAPPRARDVTALLKGCRRLASLSLGAPSLGGAVTALAACTHGAAGYGSDSDGDGDGDGDVVGGGPLLPGQALRELHLWVHPDQRGARRRVDNKMDSALRRALAAVGGQLTALSLIGSHNVGDASLPHLVACCPRLRALRLGTDCHGTMSSDGLKVLKGLSRLITLHLGVYQLSGGLFTLLCRSLRQLTTLLLPYRILRFDPDVFRQRFPHIYMAQVLYLSLRPMDPPCGTLYGEREIVPYRRPRRR